MKYKHIFSEPKEKSDKVVILLPGISGKALSDRYKGMEKELNKNNIAFFRFDLWKNVEDIQNKSLRDIYVGIDIAIEFVNSKGYSKVSFVGKSIGGGFLLTYPNSKISSLILLSPAITFGEESNLKKVVSLRFSNFKRAVEEIKINKKDLKKIKSKVLIIHGTEDEVISLENSQAMIKFLDAKLEIIKGAGHSYEKEGEMELVDKLTAEFLK